MGDLLCAERMEATDLWEGGGYWSRGGGGGGGGGVSDDTGAVWAASSSFFVILIFPILGSVPLGAYSYLSL